MAFAGFRTAMSAVSSVTNQFKAQFTAVDSLAKTSDKIGTTTEQLARLQHAASLAGMSNEQLSTSLRMFNVQMGAASRGVGEAVDAFKVLRLDAAKLATRGT